MKNFKSFVAVVLLLALCLSLTACGLSKEDAVGTWSGTYVYNGSTFAVAFVLDSDGSYAKTSLKDGSLNKVETGTYTVKGNQVVLDPDDSAGTITYKYKGGALVNNDHEFFKN